MDTANRPDAPLEWSRFGVMVLCRKFGLPIRHLSQEAEGGADVLSLSGG